MQGAWVIAASGVGKVRHMESPWAEGNPRPLCGIQSAGWTFTGEDAGVGLCGACRAISEREVVREMERTVRDAVRRMEYAAALREAAAGIRRGHLPIYGLASALSRPLAGEGEEACADAIGQVGIWLDIAADALDPEGAHSADQEADR